jgi:hypothetical protein
MTRKYNNVFVVGLLTLAIVGCKSKTSGDNSGEDGNEGGIGPSSREVTVQLYPSTASFPAMTSEELENEYQHIVETDGYHILVDGQVEKENVTVDLENPVEVTIEVPNKNDVLIEVVHPQLVLDKNAPAVFSSTFDGEGVITNKDSGLDILIDNNHYSFVTLDLNDAVYINAAALNNEYMVRSDADSYSENVYKYAYTTQNQSSLMLETDLGIQSASFDTLEAKQFKFVINQDDHGLVLDDEDHDFTPGSVVINPNRIKNAINVAIDPENGTVTGQSSGDTSKVTSIAHPMANLSGDRYSSYPLSRYEFSIDVLLNEYEEDGTVSFVNIYLTEDTSLLSRNCRANYHLTGSQAGKIEIMPNACDGSYHLYENYNEFLDAFGHWFVRNGYYEGVTGTTPVNFVFRIGGSDHEEVTDFRVREFSVTTRPSFPLNQIVYGKGLTINEDASVSGETDGRAVWAYHRVSSGTTLSDYDLNVDIDFEGDHHFINIYLLDDENNRLTANYYLSGTNAGLVGIEGNKMDLDSFMLEYADFEVRRFNDTLRIGNFFWRGGDSSYTGSGDEFTIHQFDIK